MKVEVTRSGSVAIAGVNGRVDSANASSFDKVLEDAMVGGAKSMVLDFTELAYLSSAGLRAILLTVKRTKSAGGELAVCRVPSHILEVLEVSGFTRLIKVARTVEEAKAAVV